MKSLKLFPTVTPRSLVLAVFPVAFLCLPDGVPFVYAGCGSGLSSAVSNMQGSFITAVYSPSGNVAATVSSYTLDNTSTSCQFKVSVSFTIFEAPWGETTCDAYRIRRCAGTACQPSHDYFAWGAGDHTLSQYTVQCNVSTDSQTIDIGLDNCNLVSGALFGASAASTPCDD